MPKNLNLNDLPVGEGGATGAVDYEVPPDTFVLKHSGVVYAEPGDHIHGHKHREGWDLAVYDGAACPVCKVNGSVES